MLETKLQINHIIDGFAVGIREFGVSRPRLEQGILCLVLMAVKLVIVG